MLLNFLNLQSLFGNPYFQVRQNVGNSITRGQ